ncbi:hypothetical protein QM920_04460 [Streptococcus mitis]|jgi:hypothetical protein|uniref:Uncharacterized protein n=1 Tax=Siphoviridae sp. ctNqI2 TaxID=2823576 RepID=A0A8S5LDG5_9CAUD|nr:hypothetical protein [Streptococcus sp. HMSC074B11]VNR13477.1 Uncharacterised protein [Streptococcus pneumoniae]DAD67899.1 MAG TPA: hypothetical protein [Siphoviridae sp. ctNqI2]
MILVTVGLFSLIFIGGVLLILSLIGIRQRVRLENGYDFELETDLLAMVGENRK